MPEFRDPIAVTLDTLRSDVERNPLADSLTVRRRGEQRTRHQAIGAAAAVVLVVAAVIGVSDSLTGSTRADPGPIAVSPTPAPAQLATHPFLTGSELTGIGPYGVFQDSGAVPQDDLMQCLDVPGLADSAVVRSTVLFEPDIGEATVHEHAVRFDDPAEAAAFAERVRATAAGCPPGDPAEVTSADRGPAPAAPGAYRWSRTSTPVADGDIGYYELGVSRRGNVVVVLEWSSMGNPVAPGWVWTPVRLAAAVERAVG